jgi:hypothetical protein
LQIIANELRATHEVASELAGALELLRLWVEERDYAGHEPYDLLNSPWLARIWGHGSFLSSGLIQAGRRFGGTRLREWLKVPASKNPKALALFLSGYCDLARCGGDFRKRVAYLKQELKRLCSPGEAEFCWGYDWNFVSLRGGVMRAFAANSVATVFCADALLDAAGVFGDRECEQMADSACRFCAVRLNRSWDTPEEVCFSYTPENRTLIYNNSLLIGALLARVGVRTGNAEYLDLARRAMQFVCARQREDGAWAYGATRSQSWVDGFHTGYNLCALSAYRRLTGDGSFDPAIARGYEFYKGQCFSPDGVPKYFEGQLYPVDIHACAQAVLTFCEFAKTDPDALGRAVRIARWTMRNMRSPEGSFYYQRHRTWTNRTPYMRWAQAWMFRAMARVLAKIKEQGE